MPSATHLSVSMLILLSNPTSTSHFNSPEPGAVSSEERPGRQRRSSLRMRAISFCWVTSSASRACEGKGNGLSEGNGRSKGKERGIWPWK